MNLYPFQCEGVTRLLQRFNEAHGAILADEMGLGKTIQAIATVDDYAALNGSPSVNGRLRALVVCPKFLIHNWMRELSSHAKNRTVDWQVVNYERLRPEMRCDFLIVDEAHYVKSEKAQRTHLVTAIADRAEKVLLMTGTPITDRPENIYSLLRIASPNRWGPPNYSRRQFEDRYCAPFIMKKDGREFRVTRGAANVDELADLLTRGIMVRRFKREVMKDLPSKQRMLLEIGRGRTSEWTDLSDDAVFETMRKMRGGKVAFEQWSKERAKQGMVNAGEVAQAASNILEQENQLVIFTHHKDVAASIADNIEPLTAKIDGDCAMSFRREAVDAFQAGKIRCLVATMPSLGVGVTLTSARVVLFAEIDPSPATMLQAEDRLHRIGQNQSVQVIYAVEPGTIEARIARIYATKLETLAQFGHVTTG